MFKQCFLILASLIFAVNSECWAVRDYGNNGTVCVCNAQNCDSLPEVKRPETGQYEIYTSNRDGLRFVKTLGQLKYTNIKEEEEEEVDNLLLIQEDDVLQEMYGFGGAFTDATGINILSLSEATQQQLMSSYFDKSGLDYSLCRVPIGGTDFSTRPYSYADQVEDDIELEHFALQPEDYEYKLPLIRWANNLTEGNLRLFASAWTAPKWMKINGNYSGMFGFLKLGMYQTWAAYHLKFLEHYAEEGVQFWGMTTGNEPIQAFTGSKINSVAWWPWDMSWYIKDYLGPTLRASPYSAIKLMMLDDMRPFLPWLPDWVMSNGEARDFIDGVGVHWYFDDQFTPDLLTQQHQSHPDKFILGTEACNGDRTGDVHVELGSWARGERYANSIIEDCNHWVTGWVDWNMALDTEGGPTYIENNVDSPIIVNATADEFYKQPTYYVLGHFSKFIPRESRKLNHTQLEDDEVPSAAFLRPDGSKVVVILNKKETDANVTVSNSRINIPLVVSAKSITTILYYE